MNYPLISEYVSAILSAEDNFDQLNYLRPVLDEDGTPVMTSGNFAVVFKMQDSRDGKFYAVKCFTKEQPGRTEAYGLIVEVLQKVSSQYLTPIKYLEKELFVDTKQTDETEFPVLLMDWVEGMTLEKYLRILLQENISGNSLGIEMLVCRFCHLMQWLISQPFAHGDLKPDNILVCEDGSLVLVDYDGMYVPAMKGQKARELGSPDFRHPHRIANDFDEHIDDFPAASILLSLKAIAYNPAWFNQASDRLLLGERDYLSLGESEMMKKILASDDCFLHKAVNIFFWTFNHLSLSDLDSDIFQLSPFETKVTEEEIAAGVEDEFGVVYSQDGLRLLRGNDNLKYYSVRKGTKVICDSAFSQSVHLKRVVLPVGLLKIGSAAFMRCGILDYVGCGSGGHSKARLEIGAYAFANCHKLSEFEFEDGVSIIEVGAFQKCFELRRINLEEVIRIDDYAFEDCRLINDDFADFYLHKLLFVGNYAFANCPRIRRIYLSNVRYIGNNAFDKSDFDIDYSYDDDKEIVLGNVLSVGDKAFANWGLIDSVEINEYIIHFGKGVFEGCDISPRHYCLTYVGRDDSGLPIEEIKETEFSKVKCNAPYLQMLSENGKTIQYCASTRSNIDIPSHIRIIGEGAFYENPNLLSVNIPEIISIDELAFSKCANLQRVIAADKLIHIGDSAFSKCVSLESFEIKEIERSYFGWEHDWERSSEYLADDPWYDGPYKNIPSLFSIGEDAFADCEKLVSVLIPRGIRIIGAGAFCNCKCLEYIELPEGTTSIGDGAFDGCEQLNEIIIPKGEKDRFKEMLPDELHKFIIEK